MTAFCSRWRPVRARHLFQPPSSSCSCAPATRAGSCSWLIGWELETQAEKVFKELLSNDFDTVIYKERRDDWRSAEIVISTVQSLMFNNKYQSLFSPTDFDLVISDEAHRSISGNARSVFEYFVGYKLGSYRHPGTTYAEFNRLAPTCRPPRGRAQAAAGHLPHLRLRERQPTFRYSLLDGVRDG